MPKLKTHSGSSKRFIITSKGKIKRKKSFMNHNFDSKTTKQKRRLSSKVIIHKSDTDRIKKMFPY